MKVVAVPSVILGGLLVITFTGKEKGKVQKLKKEQTKRDKAFLKCWKKRNE